MKANDHGYVRTMRNWNLDYEHRRVWSAAHGPIQRGMKVNHINGDTADNRLENLNLVTESQHRLAHSKVRDNQGRKRCTICGQFKPDSEFSKCKNGSPQGSCKPCKSEYNRQYRGRSQRKSSKP